MDLSAAERRNGTLWKLTKQSAFMCFLVACALLGASLVLWQPGEVGQGQGYAARTAAPPR